ncbi:MAG TPA: GTP-binding protein, partial [Burkholderiaceae bacterium]|nr:GTP-binding protein [Burkholderiaceae bacterium]
VGLTRNDTQAALDALSFGAREQMGLVTRLAYADLLKEASQPTLIMLDDALVHTDATRLAHMKRILYDAADRHQILLFTCHPEKWRDMGVTPRAMRDLLVS